METWRFQLTKPLKVSEKDSQKQWPSLADLFVESFFIPYRIDPFCSPFKLSLVVVIEELRG